MFHNPATGFCVLRVKLAEQREPATFVGECAQVAPGEVVRAEGSWQTSPNFGPQFRTRAIAVVPPSTTEGMEAYLASGMIKGIGRGFAKKLVEAFGEQVFEVIEHQPERLREVPGIGRGLARRIAQAWGEQKAVREIMLYLHSHGLSPLRAARIYEAYGERAIELVSANPYRLAQDIRGIGFASADELAARLGIPRDSPFRLRAGLRHVLEEALGQGHCGLPRAELAEQAATLLGIDAAHDRAGDRCRDRGARADRRSGRRHRLPVPAGDPSRPRTRSPRRCARLGRGRPTWAIADPDARVAEVERELGLRLAEGQRAALRLALVSKLLIITGGPGTGKTTLVEAILAGLGKKVEIALAAPTGRAARRLGESTGREAKTLHRLLEAEPGRGFRRGPERPLDLRPAGGRRDVDGRRAADGGDARGAAGGGGPAAGGRRRPAALGRPGPGAGRSDRLRAARRGAARPGVPPGGARARSCATRTASITAPCPSWRATRASCPTSTRSRRAAPRTAPGWCWSWSASASRRASASIRSPTSRCCARPTAASSARAT